MPNPSTPCQAKVAALCHYHGAGSEAYARVLRNKLEVAGEAYKAAQNTSTVYAAFAALRDAQKAFYATNKGLAEIETILSSPSLSPTHRSEIEKVHKAALETRIHYEKNLSLESIFPPAPPRAYQELPLGKATTINERANISTFPGKQENEICNIDWDPASNNITFSSSSSEEEVAIGVALSQDEATRKATEWYNRNFLRKN